METNNHRDIVQYAPYCSRGEVIALLYNNATRMESSSKISPAVAEHLVHAQLGDARTLEGRTIPNPSGFVGTIQGVKLNVDCYDGMVDVSAYPPGGGKELINQFVSKRISDSVSVDVRSYDVEPICRGEGEQT